MLLEQRESRIAKAKNSLVKSLGWIVIPLPVFIYFQRRLAGNGSGNREAGSPGSFYDGNSRVSRFLMNLIPIKNGYLPVIMRQERWEDY
jgi:hypothetical protein